MRAYSRVKLILWEFWNKTGARAVRLLEGLLHKNFTDRGLNLRQAFAGRMLGSSTRLKHRGQPGFLKSAPVSAREGSNTLAGTLKYLSRTMKCSADRAALPDSISERFAWETARTLARSPGSTLLLAEVADGFPNLDEREFEIQRSGFYSNGCERWRFSVLRRESIITDAIN